MTSSMMSHIVHRRIEHPVSKYVKHGRIIPRVHNICMAASITLIFLKQIISSFVSVLMLLSDNLLAASIRNSAWDLYTS